MCVICVKPKGIDMPPDSWIENMWFSNPDGAGFMYATGKKVVISKGYMKLEDFKKALMGLGTYSELRDMPIVMHFRIGTAGGNIPANTHPFPVSDTIPVLQKLSCSTKLGIVHNGIIPITTRQKDISDTMEYIAAELSPLFKYDDEFYKSKEILQMIANRTGSKFAFMNPAGEIYTCGSFTEDLGLLFSNTSYLSSYYWRRTPVHAYGVKDYDYLMADWYDESEYIDDLMLLNDNEFIIDEDTNDVYSADEATFFIDEDSILYAYDETMQCAFPLVGNYQLYSSDGGTVTFSKEAAANMIIVDQEIDFTEFMKYITETALEEDEESADTEDVPF